jgi:hypothetical protein
MSQPKTRLGSRVGLIVDLGQHKDKINYYHSYKTQIESR